MSGDLEKKLLDDLQKSGFGSELKVLETLKGEDWNVFAGLSYFDSTSKKSREIDVHALRVCYEDIENASSEDSSFEISFELWIEVKKTTHPWIILRSSSPDKFIDLTSALYRVTAANGFSLGEMRKLIASRSVAMRSGWSGHGVHEAFKKPDQPAQWFAAFTKLARVCRDPNYCRVFFKGNERRYMRTAQPLVVLDSKLFSAQSNGDGISITEIREASIDFNVSEGSAPDERPSIQIDVVTMTALSDYLKNASMTHDRLCEMARSEIAAESSQETR